MGHFSWSEHGIDHLPKKHRLHCLSLEPCAFIALPPQPAGCAPCNGAAFASLKKYATHFFNHAFGVTEPKEAPYAGADRITDPERLR
jgi:hypothetical protein